MTQNFIKYTLEDLYILQIALDIFRHQNIIIHKIKKYIHNYAFTKYN